MPLKPWKVSNRQRVLNECALGEQMRPPDLQEALVGCGVRFIWEQYINNNLNGLGTPGIRNKPGDFRQHKWTIFQFRSLHVGNPGVCRCVPWENGGGPFPLLADSAGCRRPWARGRVFLSPVLSRVSSWLCLSHLPLAYKNTCDPTDDPTRYFRTSFSSQNPYLNHTFSHRRWYSQVWGFGRGVSGIPIIQPLHQALWKVWNLDFHLGFH